MASDETLPERGPNLLEQILSGCLDKLSARPLEEGGEIAAVREEALACQREMDSWRGRRPTDDERTAMRARLVAVNARIARL